MTEFMLRMIKQMNNEMGNHVLYSSLENRCKYLGYVGAAKFFKMHADEELRHYYQFNTLLQDFRIYGNVQLNFELDLSQTNSLLSILAAYKRAEELTTQSIHELLILSLSISDETSNSHLRMSKFLHDMEARQIKEMSEVSDVFDRLNILGLDSNIKPGIELAYMDDFLGKLVH